MVENALVKLI